jgi:hypothetical protein
MNRARAVLSGRIETHGETDPDQIVDVAPGH